MHHRGVEAERPGSLSRGLQPPTQGTGASTPAVRGSICPWVSRTCLQVKHACAIAEFSPRYARTSAWWPTADKIRIVGPKTLSGSPELRRPRWRPWRGACGRNCSGTPRAHRTSRRPATSLSAVYEEPGYEAVDRSVDIHPDKHLHRSTETVQDLLEGIKWLGAQQRGRPSRITHLLSALEDGTVRVRWTSWTIASSDDRCASRSIARCTGSARRSDP